ncbi:MAG: BrnT family toxin [Longimicrobiaceae bacterium]
MHTFKDGYEWDEQKAEANLAKHGVDFAHAFAALEDERALTRLDEASDEERYVTFGMDSLGRLVAVVYTWRSDVIRIISARKATRTEARFYAAANR